MAADLTASDVPTSCGIDGSYLVERLLSTDLAAFAALAIEGITPPSEKRFWPEPRHRAKIFSVSHHESTQQMIRGLMMANELDLAKNAPHDVVMLDYGLRTPTIYLNNATSNFGKSPSAELRDAFAEQFAAGLTAYAEITAGVKRDKVYAGLPKYSTLRELTLKLGLPGEYDDRTLSTFILNPGEYLGPFPMGSWDDMHLTIPKELAARAPAVEGLRDDVLEHLGNKASVLYYKPRAYLPAFRIEVPQAVAGNSHRLGTVLRAVEFQCASPGIFEPFPLYLADRMVKHLSGAFPAFRQAVTNEMATRHDGDVGEIYLAMHSYRSEGGR